MLMNTLINILQGFFIDIIYNELDLITRYLFLIKILLHKLTSLLRRVIVNINNPIISIILHK